MQSNPVSFRAFQIISTITLLGIFGLGVIGEIEVWFNPPEFYYVGTPFVGIVLLFSIPIVPVLLFLKSKTQGFEGTNMFTAAFKSHPKVDENFKRQLSKLNSSLGNQRKDVLEQAKPWHIVWRRVLAHFIDHFLVLGFIVVMTVPFAIAGPVENAVLITLIIVGTVVAVGYLFCRDAIGGASIGKRMAGIKVVRADTGVPIGLGRSLVRHFILRVIGIVEFIVILVEPSHRRLGDMIANTVVVPKVFKSEE